MTNSKPKQTERVLRYLQQYGSITQQEADNALGIKRLGARIYELKKAGCPITSRTESVKNRYGETCHIKRYFLAKGGEACDPKGMR